MLVNCLLNGRRFNCVFSACVSVVRYNVGVALYVPLFLLLANLSGDTNM